MIPANLIEFLPNPQTPWNISQEVSKRLQPNNPSFKTAQLLPTNPVTAFITGYFLANKPPGYSIARITCVQNESLQENFVSHLSTIEEEAKQFRPSWHGEALFEEREKVIKSWQAFTQPFSPLILKEGTFHHVKTLPLWYEISSKKSQAICTSGFPNPGKQSKKTDSTHYFGNGIYFTENAHYASKSKKGFLLLSWVSMREPYPVISDKPPPQPATDRLILEGKAAHLNYNSHFIPMTLMSDSTAFIDGYPCFQNQKPAWHEIVVFEKFQALPCFIIELETDLLPSPKITFGSYEEEVPPPQDIEGHYCKKLLQAKREEHVQEQIFCLEKLGDLYVQKQNWVQAAKILNGALAILEKHSDHRSLCSHLVEKLEHLEALFIESNGLKIPPQRKGLLLHYRTQLRDARNRRIEQFQRGEPIRKVQRFLTSAYKKILSALILDSQTLLGPSPVQWACIGMGSMARDEMCPYSDLEFAFLIEKKTETNLQYFRTLSQLLELKIINFGENNFPLFGRLFGEKSPQASPTPSGFSMDSGGNTPLGKPGFYELIDTPHGLAQFQNEKWIAADIIVTNALSSVCYIFGDERLAQVYQEAKEKRLSQTDDGLPVKEISFRRKLAMKLLEGNLHEFKPDLSQEKEKTNAFGIKKELIAPFNLYCPVLPFSVDSSFNPLLE